MMTEPFDRNRGNYSIIIGATLTYLLPHNFFSQRGRLERGGSQGDSRLSATWATVNTKRLAGVDLLLNGPQGAFALGRFADLAADRKLITAGDLAGFFAEHLDAAAGVGA